MFVDISINIGLVIITCGAVIVTCESIRRVKLETWAEKTRGSRRLDFFTPAKNKKKIEQKKKPDRRLLL